MKNSLDISNFLEEISAAIAKSLQSCPTLCDPIDCSSPGSPVPGILQARTLGWVAIFFSSAWKWRWKWSYSVVSDSQWPYGLQPTRLLCPWDFPGKSTGVRCHCLLLKRSLVFPILLFSSISLHWSLRRAFLSLLAVLWNSAFRCLYLSFSPLPWLLFFSQLFLRSPQTVILLFCIYFSWGWSWFLSPIQCHEPLSIMYARGFYKVLASEIPAFHLCVVTN